MLVGLICGSVYHNYAIPANLARGSPEVNSGFGRFLALAADTRRPARNNNRKASGDTTYFYRYRYRLGIAAISCVTPPTMADGAGRKLQLVPKRPQTRLKIKPLRRQ